MRIWVPLLLGLLCVSQAEAGRRHRRRQPQPAAPQAVVKLVVQPAKPPEVVAPPVEVKPAETKPEEAKSDKPNEMDLLVAAVNKERAKYKLLPLKVDLTLCTGCREHSIRQWRMRSMHHAGGYWENVAWGQPNVNSVMVSWMNSSGHRAAILSPRARFIGMGKCGVYWTQRFR